MPLTTTILRIPLFYWFLALGLILPRIPVVGKFFNIINTAIHEFGHALVALLLNGKVNRIELFKDTSGTTTTQTGRVGAFFVALAGYPFAVSVAWLSFYLLQQGAAKGLLLGLSLLFIIMLLFWIRNGYGVLWTVLFCALNGYLIYLDNENYISYAALFYATMILTESVCSVLVLIYLSFKNPSSAGDATNLQKLTHVPAAIWSLLFAAYTGFVAYKVFITFVT